MKRLLDHLGAPLEPEKYKLVRISRTESEAWYEAPVNDLMKNHHWMIDWCCQDLHQLPAVWVLPFRHQKKS